MFPGCHPLIHSRENGQPDALFHFEGKSGNVDAGLAYSALAGRIGDDTAATVPAYLAQLQAMRTLLLGCDNSSCKPNGKKDLLTIPPLLEPGKGDRLVDLKGPLSTAATFAENLQLEYLQGMTGNQLAWGHMDEAGILSLMALHSASSDLAQRTPYIARVQASNLLAHILATVQQAEEAHLVTGAIGAPGDKVVFLVGHDTNIANVAALLDAHWLVEGYQRDDAAPGGAIVIELWQNAGGVDELRTYYVAQTPDQMRTATPLSLANPPGNATVFLPACSQKGEGSPCAWPAFRHMLESVIDPRVSD